MTMRTEQVPLRGVWHDQPAEKWEEAYLSGNGEMGLLVFGDPKEETLIGNHAQLFLPMGNQFVVPDLRAELPEFRRIIQEQGYQAGLAYHYQKALDKGYPGLTMSDPYHPAFQLQLKTAVATVSNYWKSIDYQTGEITVNYQADQHTYQSRSFVSRADGLIVYQLKTTADQLEVELAPAIFQVPQLAGELVWTDDGFHLHYHYTKTSGGYTTVGQIVAPNGTIEIDQGRMRITNTDHVLLIIKIIPELTDRQFNWAEVSYEALFNRHKGLHQELFDRVELKLTNDNDRVRSFQDLISDAQTSNDLPKALIEKIYDAGRYMYICSAGVATPNLQGIWSGTFQPAWSGDYTFDTNVQLSIASALTSHLEEGLHGLFNLIDSLLPGFRENAKFYYDSRGIMAPAHASNYGQHLHWNEEWPLQIWTCGAGWLGHWYFQYYRFTGDRSFLQNIAVPYLEEVALFYQDFLVEDEDGTYRFTPSYSAENGAADNATQDVAVAKEVLSNLIKSYQILGLESDKLVLWQAMLDRLPAYQINQEGALKEWLTPDKGENYNHRHFSHLYPIFQSREFTEETNPQMFKASRVAFEKRLEAWLLNEEGETTSTHGRMHTALCATQFHMPELIKEVIMLVINNNCFYPSLMMSHYDNQEVFNVDGNGAFPQVIHEMLVDYHHETLYLLQALPSDLDCGELSGVRLPDQITVKQLKWDLKRAKVQLSLVSKIDKQLKIKLPLYPNAVLANQSQASFSLNLVANELKMIEIKL
ncbi:glycosyl hydrolase family 95 catalytic domain-containing protein [Amphibacillus indicireducens]|uniref:Glycoside hydrolase N-terminal domain-containing protein n=1 Tax=Amphibacillus indicireducens TaxID=1076330 RepID=A0ABP7VT62_9BACI